MRVFFVQKMGTIYFINFLKNELPKSKNLGDQTKSE